MITACWFSKYHGTGREMRIGQVTMPQSLLFLLAFSYCGGGTGI
jgi:hypothetical protein